MQSKDFEFLRPIWEDVATLGAFAEQYANPDPQSAVAKLRTFAEQIVLFIFHKHGLPKPYQPNLNDLLTVTTFIQAVPRVIASKLHTLRIQGNSSEPQEGYVRLVQIRDFKTDKYQIFIPRELARRSFATDDVMIARYGPPVFQILRGLSGSYNVALMKAQPTERTTKDFIFYLLQPQPSTIRWLRIPAEQPGSPA